MKKYKVVLAHPGKQHSYQTAKALIRDDIELTYITTVYDKKQSLTSKLKTLFLSGDNLKRASSRVCECLDEAQVIQFCEFSALITLFLLRVDKSKKIYRLWNDMVFNTFGRKVAKYAISSGADMVIMYDANAEPCFQYLREKNTAIIKVLDVSIAGRPYQKAIYEKDIEETGLAGLKQEQIFLWNDKRLKYYQKEIEYSDFYMCPSKFVKKSLEYSGAKSANIKMVPYGVQLDKFSYFEKSLHDGPLRLVMCGQVNYRKGFHHLLQVMKKFTAEEVRLVVFGSVSSDTYLRNNMALDNIEYRGFVTQDKIIAEYQKSDVYIFPSLCEGLSLSVLEAMSCGLPVLLSDHSGANDVVVDKTNGMVFTVGDDEMLENQIRWFLHNRDQLQFMSKNARKTAQAYSWNNYYEKYYGEIRKILYSRD